MGLWQDKTLREGTHDRAKLLTSEQLGREGRGMERERKRTRRRGKEKGAEVPISLSRTRCPPPSDLTSSH
jgi:hypothetical protein